MQTITRKLLKDAAERRGYFDDDAADNKKRAVMSRDLRRLQVGHLIGMTDKHVWLAK